MGNRRLQISAEQSFFHFRPMVKGQDVSDFLEGSPYKLKVKPNSGKPGGKIGQQGSADTTYLLYPQNTAE